MIIDTFYDICCCHCGRWRSTDFGKGMERDKAFLRKSVKKEGWKEDKETHAPICPTCGRTEDSRLSNFEISKNHFEKENDL